MRLRYKYLVRNSKIRIELETSDFTARENKALDMLGEPMLEFQKTYPGNYTISISRKIRHNFKFRTEIDGTIDFKSANAAGKQFIEDIIEAADNVMFDFMDKFDEEEFPKENDIVDVSTDPAPRQFVPPYLHHHHR